MNQNMINVLFSLIRSGMSGEKMTQNEVNCYSDEMLPGLLKISSKHDVSHLLVLGLKQNDLIPKDDKSLDKSILKAVYRYERLKAEYEKLCNILEAAAIQFLPLKGSVLRKYYPEAWMRTSCDIDVLIHEEDLEKVKDILINENGYIYHEKGSHDEALFSPGKMHVELHYGLVEEGFASEASAVLKTVWDRATVKEGRKYFYEMPDDLFYFYHIAHMAKHFEIGGCGIRPFIDLLILDGIEGADKNKRDELIEQGKLGKFTEASRKLSRVWLENEKHDFLTEQMESFILRGGVYGSQENQVMVQQQKKGGRFKYALSKICPPYEVMKFQYPILQKHRWLTPVMEVRRWGKLIFKGHLRRSAKELHYNSNITNTEAGNIKKFLDSLGL